MEAVAQANGQRSQMRGVKAKSPLPAVTNSHKDNMLLELKF